MQNTSCTSCGSKVYFENVRCMSCGRALGFDHDTLSIIALEDANHGGGLYRRIGWDQGGLLRYCANAAHGACNWLTRADDPNALCVACDLNRTIPNLSEAGGLVAWRDFETAKKRLVYSLLRLGLALETGPSPPGRLTFDFARNITTGHLDGVITVDVMEADAVERERQRQRFGEPYRSLLGHLRHESGHYYWLALVESSSRIDEFRALFGDERADYAASLSRHHSYGPPADWQSRHVSAYASSHAWEDWAETWAHYLHMVDCVDTAAAEGMEPGASATAPRTARAPWHDVYRQETFEALMERWIPLTIAMNSLSRSMGHPDFYPVVIPGPAYEKLYFVHRTIRDAAAAPRRSTSRQDLDAPVSIR